MKIDLEKLSIKSAHNHLVKGDFTAEELTKNVLENVAAKNPEIHAYIEVFDDCVASAKQAQNTIDDGKSGVLTGIPLAIKDNILIEGKKSSAASKIIENYTAAYSATAIKRLEAEGSVFVGRTNMDDSAMGSSTENSAYGPTKNPFDTTRVPGGSSGGSAAAVAMGGALGALGSDTAGSIRQPASFCGLVGLKTTYGSVSRSGLITLGSSLDQIGPIAKTVSDAEIIFNCIRGVDPMDSTTIPEAQYLAAREEKKVSGKKFTIGVPLSLIEVPGIDADVLENFKQSVARFKKLGYEIEEIELPNVSYSLAAYYILLPGEASSNLARFDGVKYGLKVAGEKLLDDYHKTRGEGFGEEPRRRILLGTYVLSSG
ncbi:MAG: amidase family protein, partial [Patescibacteria group bacterium]